MAFLLVGADRIARFLLDIVRKIVAACRILNPDKVRHVEGHD